MNQHKKYKNIISVCVPVYNGQQFLEMCINSILSQTFTDFEVIIVDDCSSDGSYAIAKELSLKDDRIRVFRNKKNFGLVGNWNRCIEIARGEWIKFVFQDDIIDSTCLEKMFSANNPSKGFIVCRRNIIFDNIEPEIQKGFSKYNTYMSMDSIFRGKTDISATDFCKAVSENISMNFVGEPTAVMIHKNLFSQYGNFNPNYIQLCDLEFWCRIGCNFGISYIPETLATFRLHQNATSLKNRNERLYRTETIDLMLLMHEFSSKPYYLKLRTAALQNRPPHNIKLWAAMCLIREEAVAKCQSILNTEYGSQKQSELEKLFFIFPEAKLSKKYNWLRLLTPVLLSNKIKRNLYRRILMSLKCYNQI